MSADSFKAASSVFILLFLGASAPAKAGDYSVYHCESPGVQSGLEATGGQKWSLNLEGEATEEAAREQVRISCLVEHPLRGRIGSYCVKQAAEAECVVLEPVVCSGTASLEGRGSEGLRLGVVYLPRAEANDRLVLQNWYEKFCPLAMNANWFGYRPARGFEEFCRETAATLRCRAP